MKEISNIHLPEQNELKILDNQVNTIDLIKNIIKDPEIEHDPFYIVDLDDICNKHINWITSLPRVEPHYAIKCNNDKNLLKLLAFFGVGFDCASKNEIQAILDIGVSPDRIIYANPCKQASYIRYAYKNGVNLMTFDNEQELYKIKANHPNAKIVLRIITNDVNAVCRFSMKFGADMATSYKLIDLAIQLNLDLVGISFHVGSGQMSPSAFSESIENSRKLFDYASQRHDCHMTLLDLGGGFPGSSESADLFSSIAKEINKSLELYFPENSSPSSSNGVDDKRKIRIIAEPGRYYACSAFTLCLNIIAKRVMTEDEDVKTNMYYVNDGVYASFNCMFYDHTSEVLPIILKDISEDALTYKTSIWGPTCDGLDCILKEGQLPDLDMGDFLAYKNMGAYTIAGATPFNGIPLPRVIYSASNSCWSMIKSAFNKSSEDIIHFGNSMMCCADSTSEQQKINQIEELVIDENCAITC